MKNMSKIERIHFQNECQFIFNLLSSCISNAFLSLLVFRGLKHAGKIVLHLFHTPWHPHFVNYGFYPGFKPNKDGTSEARRRIMDQFPNLVSHLITLDSLVYFSWCQYPCLKSLAGRYTVLNNLGLVPLGVIYSCLFFILQLIITPKYWKFVP